MIIFKAKPAPQGKPCGRKGTVTYAIYHKEKDLWGNEFPDTDDCYIIVSPTANSSGDLTIDYLNKVYFPEVGGVVAGDLKEPCGLLLDAFRGHHDQKVKDVTEPMENLDWLLMDGGITPKAQPLDVLINKIFKGFFRDLFEEWSLRVPIHPTDGRPYPPTRQLIAQWVVKAWEKVPEELVKRSWEVCGYKSIESIRTDNTSTALVEYTQAVLGTIVENSTAGDDDRMAWIDSWNDRQPAFPEDSNDVSWDVSDDEDMEDVTPDVFLLDD